MKCSVVIVTHNRFKFIRLTIKSLINQSVLPDEIIVIDDASKVPVINEIKDLVNDLLLHNIKFKIIRTDRELGLGAARSIGARSSSGDFIVFLDDDVIASRNLIVSYLRVFSKKLCNIVAGPCYAYYLGLSKYKLPKWWREDVLGGIIAVRNDVLLYKRLNPADYVYGCNFAIDRTALEVTKGFKPWLGRVCGRLLSGEEWDLVSRALRKGLKVCFSKDAVVYHLIPILKISIRRILGMSKGLGETRCILAYEGSIGEKFFIYMLRRYIALFKDFVECLVYMLLGNEVKAVGKIYELLLHINTLIFCKNAIKYRQGRCVQL